MLAAFHIHMDFEKIMLPNMSFFQHLLQTITHSKHKLYHMQKNTCSIHVMVKVHGIRLGMENGLQGTFCRVTLLNLQ